MADEWPTVCIEDIAERVAMGPFGSSIKVETFVTDGVPVISGQHLNGFKVDDSVGFNYITLDQAERLKNANVRRGDVIFTHAGNIGQAAYVPHDSKYERYVISQRQFHMRPDTSRVLPEFVVAYFKTAEVLELAYGKALKAVDRCDGEIPVSGSNGPVGWHNERLAHGPGIVVGRKGIREL